MLAAREFTVGRLSDAQPVSLVLALSPDDSTFLVGGSQEGPVAVFLGHEPHRFHSFASLDRGNWRGLIVPNVGIEVDETSVFDPGYVSARLGILFREGADLAIHARAERPFGRLAKVVLETGLVPTHAIAAAFSRWRIVLGAGLDKRILLEVDALTPAPPP